MGTNRTNIEVVAGIAGDLTELIKVNSLAYQISGVQYSDSTSPLVFGIKKGSTTISFEIVQKTPTNTFRAITDPDGFTEELIDDIFAIFGEDAINILKTIAANDLADDLDGVIVNHMLDISTKVAAVTYDFGTVTDHRQIIHNLMLKINKERAIMAKDLKRGLPRILVVSPNVSALLITNKMISGNDSDFVAGGSENIKFIGKLGDMQVFVDLAATDEYVMIAHKSIIPGDASMILIPIKAPSAAVRRHKESGQLNIHFSHKYAYSRNPLDVDTTQLNPTDVVFTNSDNSINSALTDLTTLFSPSDNIEVQDANTVANNGRYVVSSVTANKIVVTGGLITDDTSNTATLIKDNSDFITSFALTLTDF